MLLAAVGLCPVSVDGILWQIFNDHHLHEILFSTVKTVCNTSRQSVEESCYNKTFQNCNIVWTQAIFEDFDGSQRTKVAHINNSEGEIWVQNEYNVGVKQNIIKIKNK